MKLFNILLLIVITTIAATVYAEKKDPVKLKFEQLSKQAVDSLLNAHGTPGIITSSWKKAHDKFPSKLPKGEIAKYDLNDDGIDEVFLYLSGSGLCGSAGCHLIIFQHNATLKRLAYKTARSGTNDIFILEGLSDGHRNIAIRLTHYEKDNTIEKNGSNLSDVKKYTLYYWKNGNLRQTNQTILLQSLEDHRD
ncbi:hypothetical protein SAMN05216302_101067 [Nitrosomonas aestuarii]|uniref:Uncharacterized protein n=1 Tax=Nitrosomonas aestuarii TaxID=52441 RepID=A0A1I4AW11_9PROT|nr:hypothetical protein [Nitrosomonas aestuarii]SFK60772.1 hypothetical protein SAMN05216302_101067 [Nitrosomonas aestuarii]